MLEPRIALGLLVAFALIPRGSVQSQSSSRNFLELDIGRAAAIDEQWREPRAISVGGSLARRFNPREKSALFAGIALDGTFANGSDATCTTVPGVPDDRSAFGW
jgi:hypothetical protein